MIVALYAVLMLKRVRKLCEGEEEEGEEGDKMLKKFYSKLQEPP